MSGDAFCLDRAEKAEAERDALRALVSDLRQFLPYEKPEQAPLPSWIVSIAQRVKAALA